MRRLFVLGAVMALVMAACGGGSEDGADREGDAPGQTQATQPESGNDDTNPDPSGSDDGEGEGPSTATVTIGGETYTFSSEGAVVAQCVPDLFGIMSV
ncbi:MAG: hypothetical protein OEM39_06975, partial [Acidimicrobiia bacterium]|nr:hypothetical protein [Acidimicrobiia bacterium]